MTYDPNIRQAEPGDDDSCCERIEIAFAIPVYLTPEDYRQLADFVQRIAKNPVNTPVNGVHWQSGHGAKPKWSLADQRIMGLPGDPDAPESGEPTFDDSILFFETSARKK